MEYADFKNKRYADLLEDLPWRRERNFATTGRAGMARRIIELSFFFRNTITQKASYIRLSAVLSNPAISPNFFRKSWI